MQHNNSPVTTYSKLSEKDVGRILMLLRNGRGFNINLKQKRKAFLALGEIKQEIWQTAIDNLTAHIKHLVPHLSVRDTLRIAREALSHGAAYQRRKDNILRNRGITQEDDHGPS